MQVRQVGFLNSYLPITVPLVHSRVDEEAGVAELADLASEEFDSFRAIAEDDCLRDVKLGEERVETVKLLTLF